MDIEETLEVFYKQFPYTKATLYEDCIVYNVPNKFCEKVCNEANVLIKSQNLLLIAKTNATNSIFITTVVIEPLK